MIKMLRNRSLFELKAKPKKENLLLEDDFVDECVNELNENDLEVIENG